MVGSILNHYLICESLGNIWIVILMQFEVKWTAQKQTIAERLHHILSYDVTNDVRAAPHMLKYIQ